MNPDLNSKIVKVMMVMAVIVAILGFILLIRKGKIVVNPPEPEMEVIYREHPQDTAKLLEALNWTEAEALALAEKVRASTVCLLPSEETNCGAVGFIIGEAGKGIIGSCGHCAHGHHEETGEETKNLFVRTIGGKRFPAEVLEISPAHDVGLLKVTTRASKLPPPLPFGFASVGDPVLAVGNPSGVGTWVPVVGKIMETDGWGPGGYLASFPTRPGMSGAPVVNRAGEVIGIVAGNTNPHDLLDPYPMDLVFNLDSVDPSLATIEPITLLVEMLKKVGN